MTCNRRAMMMVAMITLLGGAGMVRANTLYVTVDGTGSGGNWADPTSLTNAVAIAGPDDTVLISNGTYLVTAEIAIDKAITLQGVSGRDDTVIARDGAAGEFRLFKLSHANAWLHTLVVSNGYTRAGSGGAIHMTQGTVSNVVVTHSQVPTLWHSAGGVYMNGGRLIDSEITNCGNDGQHTGVRGGGALLIEGGEADRLFIHGNGYITQTLRGAVRMTGGTLRRSVISGNTGTYTAGIHVSGSSALVENCLVVSNSATRDDHFGDPGVGGVRQEGGRMVHVTVADNQAVLTGRAGGVYATGGSVTNSIIWNNYTGSKVSDFPSNGDLYARYSIASELAFANGNKRVDPGFTVVEGVPYQLKASSPAIDSGVNLAGIPADLAGNNRQIDGTGNGVAVADMGAYEAPEPEPGTLVIGIEALSPVTGFSPHDVVLRANAFGDDTTMAWYGWDLDGDGTPDLAGADYVQITNAFTHGRHTVRLWATNSTGVGAFAVTSNMVNSVGTNIYVSKTGDDEYPYETLQKATPTLQEALNTAIAGCVVNVNTGVYSMTEQFRVQFPLTVRGMGEREDSIIAGSGAGDFRHFWLEHADAIMDSVTISNINVSGNVSGGAIKMNAGTVTNVLITHCRIPSPHASGGGIFMSGGTLLDSEITQCGNSAQHSTGGGALLMTGGEAGGLYIHNNGFITETRKGAVRMTAGTLRRSIISGNTGTLTAGIHLSGSAQVENCLVVSNSATATSSVGGIRQEGGRVLHVTAVDNETIGTGTAGGMTATGGSVTNSIVWGNRMGAGASDFPVGGDTYARFTTASELTVANGNRNSNPNFTTVDNVPYHLATGSPCIDAGTNLTGIVIDLAGTNRVIDGTGNGIAISDMGAYEAPELDADLFVINISPLSAVSGLGPLDVVLKADAVGGDTSIDWYGWDFNNNGTFDMQGGGLGVVTNSFGPGRHSVRLAATNSSGNDAVTIASNLVTVIATNIYVSKTGDGMFPFDTLEKATTNLQEALNVAIAGCVVNVHTGIYSMTEQYRVTTPLVIRGMEGRDGTIIAGTGSGDFRPFWLDHPEAMLDSVTISNWSQTVVDGTAAYMTDGTITNVLVTRCQAPSLHRSGGGIAMAGGLLVDSEIVDCGTASLYSSGGGALFMSGGTAEGLMIRDNGFITETRRGAVRMTGGILRRSSITGNQAWETGGLHMSGNARVENCLVADNVGTAADSVGGVRQTGGELINVTVGGNQTIVTGTAGGMLATGGSVTNTIVWANLKEDVVSDFPGGDTYARYSLASELTPGAPNHNLNDDPDFEGEGDYRLQRGSIGIDAGVDQAWMETALDLQGLQRILGARVDMGCYETPPPGGTLFILR